MAVHWGGRGPGHVSRGGGLFASLRLDFLSNVSDIDPRITFTRASSATRVNSSGLIETVSSNVARIDYDPVTLAPKGLLIEEQRTNLLLRSQEFNNASWGKTNATVTADAITAPDGTTTGDKLVESATTAVHELNSNGVTFTNGTTYTFSVFAKQAGRTLCKVQMSASAFPATSFAYFDLSNGTTNNVGAGASATITSYGSGWYRCTVTATANASATAATYIDLVSTGTTTNYAGDGTSGVYVWGAQLEAGAFATSYIPTTSATVTRAADVASITGTNFSDWYNASEGTFVVEADSFGDVSTSIRYQVAASNAAATDRVNVFLYNGKWGGSVRVGGVDQCDLLQASSYTAGVVAKTALAYKANDFACSVNGNTPIPDASGAIPTVDQLFIGNRSAGNFINGHIRRVTYYPARLSNALLASLTA